MKKRVAKKYDDAKAVAAIRNRAAANMLAQRQLEAKKAAAKERETKN